MTKNITFASLGLAESILRALHQKKYSHPTPIQEKSIPVLLARKDLLGIAQTGTGKTAAFSLPILHLLQEDMRAVTKNHCRALVLAPTRELVVQISDALKLYGKYTGLSHAPLVGGVSYQHQIRALSSGVDILVATPGRLMDLVKQGYLKLSGTAILVLDEADRMLDMGFIHDVRKIMALLPKKRQSLLFSATMPDEITKLAKDMLHDPVRVEISPQTVTLDAIEQRVYPVPAAEKRIALTYLLTTDQSIDKAIIFARTKHGSDRISHHLTKANIRNGTIHRNKSQSARQKALRDFRDNKVRVLVATDIVARGIDVPDVSHVINFDLPVDAESYVHRIGRTGRAGAKGVAISLFDNGERASLRNIEKLTKKPIPRVDLNYKQDISATNDKLVGLGSAPADDRDSRREEQDRRGGDGKSRGRRNNRQDFHRGKSNRDEKPFGRLPSGERDDKPVTDIRASDNRDSASRKKMGQDFRRGKSNRDEKPFGRRPSGERDDKPMTEFRASKRSESMDNKKEKSDSYRGKTGAHTGQPDRQDGGGGKRKFETGRPANTAKNRSDKKPDLGQNGKVGRFFAKGKPRKGRRP